MFDKPSAFTKYIHTPLVSIVNIVTSYRRIAVGRNPNASKIVTVNSIVDELAKTIFVDVDATCLAVMNFALYDGRISTSFHFETGDPIVVNIVGFEKSL